MTDLGLEAISGALKRHDVPEITQNGGIESSRDSFPEEVTLS